jgi:hypothetical protein
MIVASLSPCTDFFIRMPYVMNSWDMLVTYTFNPILPIAAQAKSGTLKSFNSYDLTPKKNFL